MAAASSRGSTGSASTPRWTRSGRRKRRPVQPYPELDDESWQPPAGAEADPERTASLAERTRALAGALAGITDDQRSAIVLYDIEGYDYAEIAEMTGVSLGTVKSRIHRGRLALRDLLERPDGAVPWLIPGTPHAEHDPLIVATLLDREIDGDERAIAEARIASCASCATLHADLLALSRGDDARSRPRHVRVHSRSRPRTPRAWPRCGRGTGRHDAPSDAVS